MALRDEINTKLYDALMKEQWNEVIQLCKNIPGGPLHILSIHDDTVLQLATYSEQNDLVLDLLKQVGENKSEELVHQNDVGNTVLHEAAISHQIVPAAKEMLRRAPALLGIRNKYGETALLRSARHGNMEMFKFLDEQVNTTVESEIDRNSFHVRDEKTTILHVSVLELALLIAKKYEYLIRESDAEGMTALQLLACNPLTPKIEIKLSSLKRFIHSCASIENTSAAKEGKCCRVPLWETIRTEKQRHESAWKLAKFLIEKDTTWNVTNSAFEKEPRTHKYRAATISSSQDQGMKGNGQNGSAANIAITPLFLATESGCTEIVEEILRMHPQAVEQIDNEGRNILHAAIKYRHMQIFDIVEAMKIPMKRMARKTDKNRNTLLHMVCEKAGASGAEDMRSPAIQLREDLLLFERVKAITGSTAHFYKQHNSKGLTAKELFVQKNTRLHKDAKEWVKRTAENCSIVAVLIATVAFAAAYTVPGGPNQNTGYPILENQPFFVIFTMTDVLSLTLALASVITFLSILASPFKLNDFKQSLPQKLMLGFTLLIFSVSMMMLAFAATVILLIRNKERWTKIALYSVVFFPVTIFAFSNLPLYLSLLDTFKYSLNKIVHIFPRFNSVQSRRSWIGKLFKFNKSQAPIPSNLTQSQATDSTPPTSQTTRSLA